MFHNKLLSRTAMIAVVCSTFAPALAHAGILDLSRYSVTAAYNSMIHEASGITYNWDNDSLFIVSDSVNAVELSKTGAVVGLPLLGTNGTSLTAFGDTEGVAYVGGGQYVLADERHQTLSLIHSESFFNFPDGTTRHFYSSKSDSPTYALGPRIGNIGIEGVSYDPSTGNFFAVKETNPQGVFEADISFGATTATTTGSHVELFDPALLGLITLSDIQVLSMPWFEGSGFEDNLLILSATSQLLLEVTRSGEIVSSLDLTGMATKIEGVTIDKDGNIYMVSESGLPGNPNAGAMLVLTAAPVPEPGTALLLLGGLAGLGLHARRRRQGESSLPAVG